MDPAGGRLSSLLSHPTLFDIRGRSIRIIFEESGFRVCSQSRCASSFPLLGIARVATLLLAGAAAAAFAEEAAHCPAALQASGGLRYLLILFGIVCFVVGFSGELLYGELARARQTSRSGPSGDTRALPVPRESSCETRSWEFQTE